MCIRDSCESGSGRRAAGAHSKLDSQPGLSPGCLAANDGAMKSGVLRDKNSTVSLARCAGALSCWNDVTDSASVSRVFRFGNFEFVGACV